jgi:hypothetical protein
MPRDESLTIKIDAHTKQQVKNGTHAHYAGSDTA